MTQSVFQVPVIDSKCVEILLNGDTLWKFKEREF